MEQTCCRDEQFAGQSQWGDRMLVNQSRQAACEDGRKGFKSLSDIFFMCSDISRISHDVLKINRHKKSNASLFYSMLNVFLNTYAANISSL